MSYLLTAIRSTLTQIIGSPMAPTTTSADPRLEAFLDLQENSDAKGNRAHKRIQLRARCTVWPGDASRRGEGAITTVCNDVSARGCRVISITPIMVGDLYRLEFDQETLDVAPVFSRCLRCRLLRDDAYEVGFAFFAEVDLREEEQESSPSDFDDII
jgi:hypothetical protein